MLLRETGSHFESDVSGGLAPGSMDERGKASHIARKCECSSILLRERRRVENIVFASSGLCSGECCAVCLPFPPPWQGKTDGEL
jgi:hypothetical protein